VHDPGDRPTKGAALGRRVAVGAAVVLTVAYPLVVYATLARGTRPRRVAAVLAVLYGLSLLAGWLGRGRAARAGRAARPLWPALACVLVAAILDTPWALLAMPVAINLALLVSFAATLRRGATPMVERFARVTRPDLSPTAVVHCRQATWAWTVFFALNAAVTAALARFDPALWALHTGLLAYVAMGLLFAGEYAVRRVRMARDAEDAPAPGDPPRPVR